MWDFSPVSVKIPNVGKPFQLGRHVREPLILCGCQRGLGFSDDDGQFRWHYSEDSSGNSLMVITDFITIKIAQRKSHGNIKFFHIINYSKVAIYLVYAGTSSNDCFELISFLIILKINVRVCPQCPEDAATKTTIRK